MSELKLTIETDAAIGTSSAAQNILDVLTRDQKWTPDRYGQYEPLRGRYVASAPEVFVEAWVQADRESVRIKNMLFSKRKIYDAAAIWFATGPEMNSLHIAFHVDMPDHQSAQTYLELASALFSGVEGQYGHLCAREEYFSKNMTEFWTSPEGFPEGGRAFGTDRTKHLPGIYWANFFGPAYVDFFGPDRFESAPAYLVRRLPLGWLLLTAATPQEWSSAAACARENALREHFGRDAFFSMDAPDRETRAPTFRRS